MKIKKLLMMAMAGGSVAETPWYLEGDITAAQCVAAYQPIGAARLAASYVNMANPGTYNAPPGVAPDFDTATGWTFNGSSQYLTTGYTETDTNTTMIVQFTGCTPATALCGAVSTGHFILRPKVAAVTFRHGGNTGLEDIGSANMTFGNLAISKNTAYKNGSSVGTISDFSTSVANAAIFLGCGNVGGSPSSYLAVTIAAFAIYNVELSSTQITALVAKMAVLPL